MAAVPVRRQPPAYLHHRLGAVYGPPTTIHVSVIHSVAHATSAIRSFIPVAV